jgi:hypothetical protein
MASKFDPSKAPGHFGNQGTEPPKTPPVDKEERHQRMKDQVPDDSAGELTSARPKGRDDTPEGLKDDQRRPKSRSAPDRA